jgi:hypothetical protein
VTGRRSGHTHQIDDLAAQMVADRARVARLGLLARHHLLQHRQLRLQRVHGRGLVGQRAQQLVDLRAGGRHFRRLRTP